MITITDMHRQTIEALDAFAAEFDVDAIVDEIHGKVGLVNIDDLGPEFWQIAEHHAIQDWFFTFGVGQGLLAKRYVKIRGTYDGARKIMIETFGKNWAFQYASPQAAGVEQYGLTAI